MPIPEQQLLTWAKQGATGQLSDTQQAVREALQAVPNFRGGHPTVYLQGSYKNDTNVHGDSDVDVVIQSPLFYWNRHEFNPLDQQTIDRRFPTTDVTFMDFRAEVISALERQFGTASVKPDNKCIRLLPAGKRKPADIIPCFEYRRISTDGQSFVEGIQFLACNDNRWVVNYPKSHYENGVTEQGASNGNYKPAIRMFKNARIYLVSQGRHSRDIAPSYFVECLLYNIPTSSFVSSRSDTFYNILKFLKEPDVDFRKFVCQNQQLALFGDSKEQWQVDKAQAFVASLVNLWNNWGR